MGLPSTGLKLTYLGGGGVKDARDKIRKQGYGEVNNSWMWVSGG